ncbi:unnamed protein product [Penicillium salamii]|nr:unnamed protein product [Penicillium salamii]
MQQRIGQAQTVCTYSSSAFLVLNLVECDLDLDLHAIWQESSGIPTPPPCLATDHEQPRQIFSDESEPTGYAVSRPSSIESFLLPTHDNDKLPVFQWKSGEMTEERIFFLRQVETAAWSLCRIRGELPDVISWHGFDATAIGFRLFLWPRMKSLEYSSQPTVPPLGALPTTLSLNPKSFVHNIVGGYR